MTTLVFDIEADSLNPTKIHCIAVGDIHGNIDLYVGEEIGKGVSRLSSASVLIGHNSIGYDLPVLRRLAQLRFSGRVVDTLTCTSLLWPDAEGGHSLEAWGKRLGVFKGDYQGPWDVYSERMGEYCKQDVAVTIRLWQHIKKELDSHDWKRALRLEHRIAEIMHQQAVDGWKFDVEGAKNLVAYIDGEVEAIDASLQTIIPKKCKKKGATIEAPFKQDGSRRANVSDWYGEDGCSVVAGPFSRIVFDFPNLGSRDQLAELFMAAGWKPKEFTETGKPKLDKDTLEALAETDLSKFGPVVGMLVRKAALLKRRGLLLTKDQDKKEKNGLLDNVRQDGTIASVVIPHGTRTGRMTHRIVANIPKAEESILLGKEIRQLFQTRDKEKRRIVGADAAGIQLRLLAHYMNDDDFTHALLKGKKWETDAHSLAAIDAGLDPKASYVIDGRGGCGRDIGKTINYALIFRAQGRRMGEIIGKDKAAGDALRSRMLARMPNYNKLVERLELTTESRGYLIGLDGRKVKPSDPFKSLVELIQGAEAICMKVAICRMKQLWGRKGLDAILVGTYHDETQSDVLLEHTKEAAECFNEGLKYASDLFKLRCPLEGEMKVGLTWAQTH